MLLVCYLSLRQGLLLAGFPMTTVRVLLCFARLLGRRESAFLHLDTLSLALAALELAVSVFWGRDHNAEFQWCSGGGGALFVRSVGNEGGVESQTVFRRW
jgi:hypothetical protein